MLIPCVDATIILCCILFWSPFLCRIDAEGDAEAEPVVPNSPGAVPGTGHSAGAYIVMTSPRPADEDSNQAANGTRLLPTATANNIMHSHLADDDDEPEVPSDCDMDEHPSPLAHEQVGYKIANDAVFSIF
jgi:hypothetical protein